MLPNASVIGKSLLYVPDIMLVSGFVICIRTTPQVYEKPKAELNFSL